MDIIYKKADLLDALKEIEQSVLADVLHEIIMFGGAFKLIDIVNLLKNLSIQDQQVANRDHLTNLIKMYQITLT